MKFNELKKILLCPTKIISFILLSLMGLSLIQKLFAIIFLNQQSSVIFGLVSQAV